MNNVIDTSYLALELTKLYFNNKKEDYIANNYVDTYKEILYNLLNIKELPDIKELEQENMLLKDKLKNIGTPDGMITNKIDGLCDIINCSKGDMEPIVYDQLMLYIHDNLY